MNIQNIPDNILESEVLKIRSFFLEVPYKKWKKILWELYSSYVYETRDINSGKENSEMLLMYEDLRRLLKELNRLNKEIKAHEK